MKDKNLNKIAAVEKAISERYGDDTIQNPRANWDEEKDLDDSGFSCSAMISIFSIILLAPY